MAMQADTDFNISDETTDDDSDTGDTTTHAGDETDTTEVLDRGDEVAPGQGEEGGDTTTTTDDTDPEFLATLAGDEGGKPQMVPYPRMAEVVAQNRRLMDVLEGITSGRLSIPQPVAAAPAKEAEPAFDMRAQIKARNAALLEGDEEAAAEIDMTIEEHRNTTIRAQARQEAMADFEGRQQQQTLETIVADAFGKYTFLADKDAAGQPNPDYNPEALDEVMMYRNHYVQKGDALPVALQKAINKVCPQYIEEDETPEQKELREKAEKEAIAKGGRDPAKVIRNAKAAASQPAALATAGTPNRETIDTNKLDLENMSDEEYDKLPESVKAKARGDVAA